MTNGSRAALTSGDAAYVHYSHKIYNHFQAVYTTIRRRLGVRLDVQLHDVPAVAHAFRQPVKGQMLPFELWPKKILLTMAFHGPVPTAPHPTHTSQRTDYTAAKLYMTEFKAALRWLPPVHADVWLRATLRMLPVNARYSYKRDTEPWSLECQHDGCTAVETQEHALHACTKVAPLWALHQVAWQVVGVTFAWSSILDLDHFCVGHRGRRYKDALFQVWVMLVGATLHTVWMQRNHTKHRHRAMPPTHVMGELTFLLWLSSVRRWMRLQAPDDPVVSDLKRALALLLHEHPYNALRAKHPRCLDLESSFDVH